MNFCSPRLAPNLIKCWGGVARILVSIFLCDPRSNPSQIFRVILVFLPIRDG